MDSVWVSCTFTFAPGGKEIGVSGIATTQRSRNRLGLAMKPPHRTYCAMTSAPLTSGTVRIMRVRLPCRLSKESGASILKTIFSSGAPGRETQASIRLTMNPFSGEWMALAGSAGKDSMRSAPIADVPASATNSSTDVIGTVPVFSAAPLLNLNPATGGSLRAAASRSCNCAICRGVGAPAPWWPSVLPEPARPPGFR